MQNTVKRPETVRMWSWILKINDIDVWAIDSSWIDASFNIVTLKFANASLPPRKKLEKIVFKAEIVELYLDTINTIFGWELSTLDGASNTENLWNDRKILTFDDFSKALDLYPIVFENTDSDGKKFWIKINKWFATSNLSFDFPKDDDLESFSKISLEFEWYPDENNKVFVRSYSISSQTSNSEYICANKDWTKIYIWNGSGTILQYNLTNNFSLSSVSYFWSFNVWGIQGLTMWDDENYIFVNYNRQYIQRYSFWTIWNITTLSADSWNKFEWFSDLLYWDWYWCAISSDWKNLLYQNNTWIIFQQILTTRYDLTDTVLVWNSSNWYYKFITLWNENKTIYYSRIWYDDAWQISSFSNISPTPWKIKNTISWPETNKVFVWKAISESKIIISSMWI